MCLGVYGKVLEVKGDLATVDFGGGLVKNAFVGVEEVAVNDYVVVHAGIIVSKLNEAEFTAAFNYLEEAAKQLPTETTEPDEYILRTRKRLETLLGVNTDMK